MKTSFDPKAIVLGMLLALALISSATVVAKGWHFFKVVRTVDRVLRANNVPITY